MAEAAPIGPPKMKKMAKVVTRTATETEKGIHKPEESFADITSAMVVPQMFGKPKPKAAPKPVIEEAAAALVTTVPVKRAAAAPAQAQEEPLSVAVDLTTFPEPLQRLGKPILEEQYGNPYLIKPAPSAFVPTTRRGFADSIESIFGRFALPPPAEEPDFESCAKQGAQGAQKAEIYLYQQFVREYLRNESPYRGLLVYHGLGSGKTCSAIATAEALFSTSRKHIVVMTPFSLRKNFIKEITFCGFQHFRLQNFWVPLDMRDPTVRLFGEQVYGLPKGYKASTLWIPDFSRKATPNYGSLSSTEQTEIRKQINDVINSRITFINYNGITASRLKEFACRPPSSRPFDNSVIVIDEVHNLIRLMQGTIEPYLTNLPNLRRKIQPEPVKSERWTPGLCGKAANYKRGYLFYRLLLDARNSKIVALSGTPLINFPEELAILANVLHGYINIAQTRVDGSDPALVRAIEDLAAIHPHIDFVRVTPTPQGTQVLITPLPEGTRKKPQGGEMAGVERIPEGEPIPTIQEIAESFKKMLLSRQIRANEFQFTTEPLLPPFGQTFRDFFLKDGAVGLKNENVLSKRLTGLISYYKGSKKELMPEVTSDVIVECPMSSYSASEYGRIRSGEINIEEKSKKQKQGTKLSQVWSEIYEIATGKQSNNYRMASRQACNFTFPEEVTRPRPRNKKEEVLEAGIDPNLFIDAALEASAAQVEDIVLEEAEEYEDQAAAEAEDEAIEDAEEKEFGVVAGTLTRAEKKALIKIIKDSLGERTLQEIQGEVQDGRQVFTIALAAPADRLALLNKEFKTLQFTPQGFTGTPSEALKEDLDVLEAEILQVDQPEVEAKTAAAAPVQEEVVKKLTMAEMQAQRARDLADCKAGLKPGEKYQAAIERSKRCLRQFCKAKLKLTSPPPNNLQKYSDKYAKILEMIESSPGSNLVYSQFLEMEGIGIFSLVMDMNGYVPIEIEIVGGVARFSAKTAASLAKGPQVKEWRYIKFTGGEVEEVRKYALDIFNARFNELPKALSDILMKAGYTDNKTGQLCRVFCITSAGAEGLSLKNVRRVHIMEPYWNDIRLAQVKGRAVRICSHMDLPYDPDPAKNQRTVEVFTYVTVFPEAMQKAQEGENKIDETIRMKDSISAEDARMIGVRVPQGVTEYVMTSDERLLLVSNYKKNIIQSLERVMKSSAVDCRLNTYDNDDGTFRCLPLRGKVGDFLYHPILIQDILESSVAFKQQGPEQAAAAVPEPIMETVYNIELGGRKLLAASVKDAETQIILSYDLYDAADKARVRKVGTMTADATTGLPTGEATFF